MKPVTFLAALLGLAACDAQVESRKAAVPAEQTTPAAAPLTAAGPAATVQPDTEEGNQWAAAVVELTPDAIATLKPLATGDRALPSGLVDGIATAVPAGRTLGSDALDARLVQGAAQAGWGVKAVLIEGTSTLVLAGLGE